MSAARRRLLALIVLTVGSGAAILDGTVVTLALPHITDDLGGGLAAQQWIVDGYMLSLASLILLGGSLGDIFGRKRIYLIGVAGFGIMSLVCALAPNVELLIAARILQGVFGALMTPGALAIITASFPKNEQAHDIGRWTSWSSIAVLMAPLIGGGLLALGDWRYIFLINVPLAIFCLVVGTWMIDESKDETPRRLDYLGAVLVWLGLAGVTLGLIEGPHSHWPSWTIVSLALGLIFLVAFVLWEHRARDPMLRLSLFKSRNFSGSNLMTFLMYGALGGLSFALVLYLQNIMSYQPLIAGLTLLPTSILMMLFSGKVGKLSGRYGARRFMTIGPVVAGLGMGYLYFLHPGDSFWLGILPGVLLFGVGLTLMVAPLTATVMSSVKQSSSGIASGINNAVARSASLIVVALLGLVGAGASMYHFGMALCAVLAVGAGLISYFTIRNLKPDKDLV